MAWQEPVQQRITVEEWRAILERSGIRYEYHDGYLVAMSGGTLDHTQIGFNAVAALRTVLRAGSCRAYGSDAAVRFLPTAYRFCDAVVTCDPRDRGDSREVQTPMVVLEALSPSTERNDRTEKFALVRSCPSVREYVLVWTRYQFVEVYRRADPAWTAETYWPGDDVVLQCLAVRFPLASLYEDTEVPDRPEEAP